MHLCLLVLEQHQEGGRKNCLHTTQLYWLPALNKKPCWFFFFSWIDIFLLLCRLSTAKKSTAFGALVIPVPSIFSPPFFLPTSMKEGKKQTQHWPLSKVEKFYGRREDYSVHEGGDTLCMCFIESIALPPPPPFCHLSEHTHTKVSDSTGSGHSVQRAGTNSFTTLLCDLRQITSPF